MKLRDAANGQEVKHIFFVIIIMVAAIRSTRQNAKNRGIISLAMTAALAVVGVYNSSTFMKPIDIDIDYSHYVDLSTSDLDRNETSGNKVDEVEINLVVPKEDSHEGGDYSVVNTEEDNNEWGTGDLLETDLNGTNSTDDETNLIETNSNNNQTSLHSTDSTNVDSCTSQNSEAWLSSKRISNIDENLMTDELIESLILGTSPLDTDNGSRDILEQSLCLNDSNFINWKPTKTKFKDQKINDLFSKDRAIKDIAFRLMFLAFHEHQYGPARKEAIARYRNIFSCRDTLKKLNVPRFDFECPDTKYIVVAVDGVGFGAAVRAGLMDPMFLGLTLGRVVLFINSVSVAPEGFIRDNWLLGSCPRRDMQCSFMPSSPCVITEEDLQKAPTIPKDDMEDIRRTGKLGPEYENEKVVIFNPNSKGHQNIPTGLRTAFVNIISSLYNGRAMVEEPSHDWEFDEKTLQKAKDYILNERIDRWIPHQAATFYVLRPNMEKRNHIEKAIEAILPENFDFQSTFGFPIRGT